MTQPPITPNYQMQPQPQGSSGLAVASLVLGIIAVFSVCLWFISIPLGVIAIVLGVVTLGKVAQGQASGGGMAKAGMILGIVACVIAIIIGIVFFFIHRAANAGGSYLQRKAQEFQKQADEMQKQAEEAQKKAQEQLQHQQQNPLTQPSGSVITPMQWRAPAQIPGFSSQTLFLVLPQCA